MASGRKLADAYVEIRPEDSRARGETRVKAQRMGKEFGGALNSSLKRLNLDPINMKADPAQAFAAITATEVRLRQLVRDAPSLEMQVRTQDALNQLSKMRRRFGDEGLAIGAAVGGGVADGASSGFARGARSIGDQINASLRALELDEIDLRANPRDAVAAIEETRQRLRDLSTNASTVDIRVRAESAYGELGKLRNRIGDVGGESAAGFAAKFSGRVGPLLASMPITPHTAAALAAAGAAGAPVFVSALSAALSAGAGAAVLGVGLAAIASDPVIAMTGSRIGERFTLNLQREAKEAFQGPVLVSLNYLDAAGQRVGARLGQAFDRIAPSLIPFTLQVIRAGEAVTNSLAAAAERSGPALDGLGDAVALVGDGVAYFINVLSDNGPEAADNLRLIAGATADLLRYTANTLDVMNNLANNAWVTGPLLPILRKHYKDTANESERFQQSQQKLPPQLDLTALAARGQREAFAALAAEIKAQTDPAFALIDATQRVRKAQEEVATATRLHGEGSEQARAATRNLAVAATELQARNGALGNSFNGELTPAMRAAYKAAGLTEQQIADIAAEMQTARTTGDDLAKGQLRLAPQLDQTTRAVSGQREAFIALSNEMRAQTDPVFALRNAQDKLRDAQDAVSDSGKKLREAQLDVAKAVREHGAKSDEAKAASQRLAGAERDTRAATRDLAGAAIDLQNRTGALGSTFKARLTPEMYATLRAAGLTKDQINRVEGEFREAKKAGDTYARNYKANVQVTGDAVARAKLAQLVVLQTALKKGVSMSAARADAGDAAAARDRGVFHAGGWTGPGSKYDEAGIVHRDEYVIRKESRRRIEQEAPGALDEMNQFGRLPARARPSSGYAAGGVVFWPFPTTARMTRIPSRAEATRVVAPLGPSGTTGPWMERLLESRFRMNMISGYRPGSRTLSGNLSYHALNRAVDFPPSREMAAFMYNNYKSRLKEAITPYPQYNVRNGRDHRYTGAVWRQHAFGYGNAHNHFAMANGGRVPGCPACDAQGRMPTIRKVASADTGRVTLERGLNLIANGTGKPEPLSAGPTRLHPDDIQALAQALAAVLGAVMRSAAPAAKVAARQAGRGIR